MDWVFCEISLSSKKVTDRQGKKESFCDPSKKKTAWAAANLAEMLTTNVQDRNADDKLLRQPGR